MSIRRVLLTWASILVFHSHFLLHLWNKENKTGLMPFKYVVEQLIFTKRCHTGTQYLLNLFFFRFHPFCSQVIYVTNHIYIVSNILNNRENSGNTYLGFIPSLEEIWIMPILKDLFKHLALCKHIFSHYELLLLSLSLWKGRRTENGRWDYAPQF